MGVLDRCGTVYRSVQISNNGHGGSVAADSGAQNNDDFVIANCEDKQEKNSLTCVVTANGNDTATVKLNIRFSANQGKKESALPRRKQQKSLHEESGGALVERVCCATPSPLVLDMKAPSKVAECPSMCGLLLSCE